MILIYLEIGHHIVSESSNYRPKKISLRFRQSVEDYLISCKLAQKKKNDGQQIDIKSMKGTYLCCSNPTTNCMLFTLYRVKMFTAARSNQMYQRNSFIRSTVNRPHRTGQTTYFICPRYLCMFPCKLNIGSRASWVCYAQKVKYKTHTHTHAIVRVIGFANCLLAACHLLYGIHTLKCTHKNSTEKPDAKTWQKPIYTQCVCIE